MHRSLALLLAVALVGSAGATQSMLTEEHRQCYSHQQTLGGALYGFWRDYPDLHGQADWARMQEEGHLHMLPDDPGQARGSSRNYLVSLESPTRVTCTLHGNPDIPRFAYADTPGAYHLDELLGCLAFQRYVSGALAVYAGSQGAHPGAVDWGDLSRTRLVVEVPEDARVNYEFAPWSELGVRCRKHGGVGEWGGAAFFGGAGFRPVGADAPRDEGDPLGQGGGGPDPALLSTPKN